MAIKIRENIPEQNDILDYANEMIDELEALKAIAGRTEEKEKEEEAVPEKKEKTSDTQKSPTPKSQSKKPAVKKVSSEEEDMDGYFKLMLYLPKDYEKKFRVMRAVTKVSVLDWIRDSVLELIDKAWEESKEQIEAEVRKMYRKD